MNTTTTIIRQKICILIACAALVAACFLGIPTRAGPYADPPQEPAWAANEETTLRTLSVESAMEGNIPNLAPQSSPPLVPSVPGQTFIIPPVLLDYGDQKSANATPRPPVLEGGAWAPLASNATRAFASPSEQQDDLLAAAEPSPLRALYAARAGQNLPLFGYDLFAGGLAALQTEPNRQEGGQKVSPSGVANIDAVPLGALAEDVVLRSGDKVEIVFTGQRTDRDVHRINAQGLLLIPDFPPIPAAGRTLGDVRVSLESETANLHNTKIHVSVFSIGQISVLVTGHVRTPGRLRLSSFHTVLDALIAAGGVIEQGSLRTITLHRGEKILRLDLYALLLEEETNAQDSVAPDMPLHEGDVIVVPSIGPTVAVAGDVGRPSIYELSGTHERLSLDKMLALGGGVLAPGANRFMRMTALQDGREEAIALTPSSRSDLAQFGAGDILVVVRGQGRPAGQVRLAGHTTRPGVHVLAKAGTLKQLLAGPEIFGPDIYNLAAVLERRGPKDAGPSWQVFSPAAVLTGKENARLREGDIVHLFSRAQIRALAASDGSDSAMLTPATPLSCTPGPAGGLIGQTCTGSERILDPVMIGLLREHAAFVRGGVRVPGPWPVAGSVSLSTLIAAAGGVTTDANTQEVEVTRLPSPGGTQRLMVNVEANEDKTVFIGPGDTVQIRKERALAVAGDSVWIGGEVARPGTYGFVAGETLSGLMVRAGGLTPQAYPEGAIFSRAEARRAEEARYRAAAMDIEQAVTLAHERRTESKRGSSETSTENGEAKILMAKALADELRSVKGLGRVGVEARPDVLAVHRAQDTVLIAGDRLYVPPRPASVRVVGEVLSPGFMPFRSGKTGRDYINEAAGMTYFADKARSFVLYPDGTAQRLSLSSWSHAPTLVPPGSTIVVPRDPKPFDFIATTRDLSQILANLAITTIFIDDVINDD